jgi:AcrR family transcriptional regulator
MKESPNLNIQSDKEQNGEGAKERIVAGAVRLFCLKGYEATSVREIVEAAGVTKPVLYYYFKNKEDLFHAIFDEALSVYGRRVAEVCAPSDGGFREQLEAIKDVYVQAGRRNPDLVRFVHAIAFSGLYNDVIDFHGHWERDLEHVASVFARARDRGLVRRDVSPRVMADAFLGAAMNALHCIIYHTSPEEVIESLVENVVALFTEGAAPKQSETV